MTQGKPQPASADQIAKWGHIAGVVRAALEAKHMTVSQFNEAAGLARHNSEIYQIRACKSGASPRMARLIHKILGVPVADLAPRAPSKMPTRALTLAPRPYHRSATDVLGFSIDEAGKARLKLDFTATPDVVVPILRMLLDLGLVISKGDHRRDYDDAAA